MDQERIAGARGHTRIGGVARTGRSERKHLPDRLTRRGGPVEETRDFGTEVADRCYARQRRGMENEARPAGHARAGMRRLKIIDANIAIVYKGTFTVTRRLRSMKPPLGSRTA
jgi:hypothetical protein